MSGTYDFTIAAGASQRFPVIGNKAKIISASAATPLKIRLDSGDAYSCLEGQGAVLPDGKYFSEVTVSNPGAAAQTGFIFIGDAAFEDTRITGDVRVIDQIASSVITIGAGGITAVTGFVADPILLPANNPRGAIVRGMQVGMQAGAGGTVNGRILTGPSAPVGFSGNQYPFLIMGSNGTIYTESNLFDIKKRIPAGWGLWYYYAVTVSAAAINSWSVAYEPL